MEENTEIPTEGNQVEEPQLSSTAVNEAETVATGNTDALSLAEITELTGMNYKDKDSALKSIKDMKSQAGKAADLEGKLAKAKEATSKGGNPDVAELKEQLNQLQKDAFYSQNPEVNRDLAETIAKANAISPQEAVTTDLYKNTVATPEKRTVAQTNNRIARPKSDSFDPKGKSADEIAQFVAETYINK